MKSVIAGAGRVGQHIARELIKSGHDLVIIEKDKARAETISSMFDAATINASVTDVTALQSAVSADTDSFIAVTESDEINLSACLLAGKLGAKKKVARIRNEEWFSGNMLAVGELGLDAVIHPELEAVNFIGKIMGIEGAFDFADLAAGGVELLGFQVDPGLPIVGMSLSELKESFSLDFFLIIGLFRDGEFFVPGGSDRVESGDRLWLLTARETEPFILPIFGKREGSAQKSVAVLGATRIGVKTAEFFEVRGAKVTLMEQDPALAQAAGERLDKVKVLRVDRGEEPELLRELGPESIDCFIAASAEGRDNIMTSLLAKRLGVRKTVVVTDESAYLPVMDTIGIDVVVNPYILTAGAMLAQVRKGIVHSVVKLRAGEAELIEYNVPRKSAVTGKALSKVGWPRGSIVGMVVRGDDIIIPDGSTELLENDRVVVVSTPERLSEVEKLFASRRFL